jgi:hypothetical protein
MGRHADTVQYFFVAYEIPFRYQECVGRIACCVSRAGIGGEGLEPETTMCSDACSYMIAADTVYVNVGGGWSWRFPVNEANMLACCKDGPES